MTARFPIVDAHQHFWDPRANYHPWLCDETPIAFRYGDYSALRRPYLPADYLADAGAHEVVKTVYVETEWDPRDPLGETAWVERLRRETGLPTVMVAQAWLDRDDAAAVLERQAAFAFVRGVRHKPRRGAMRDARWRAGYARLARAQALKVRELDYVAAARTLGASNTWIFFRHILPNILQPVLVQAMIGMAGAILAESTLSFLGLGVRAPTRSLKPWRSRVPARRGWRSTASCRPMPRWWPKSRRGSSKRRAPSRGGRTCSCFRISTRATSATS